MRKTWAVALKEIRQAMRDPLSLLLLIGFPAFVLIMYGYALNFDVKHIRLAVQDLDQSRQSRDFVAAFTHSRYFDLVADVPAGADLDELIASGHARCILIIPEKFAEKLDSDESSPAQFLLDGSDSNTASTALSYAGIIAAQSNVTLLADRLGPVQFAQLPTMNFEPRVWYNPELRSTNFLVPGLMGFVLMLTAVLSTALSVVREKERGTLEQLRVAPLGIGQLLLGKSLPYLVMSMTATGIMLAAAHYLFHVYVRGSYVQLFAITLLYLVGALGFGLLVSTLAHSQAMAFQLGTITSMLPAVLLSGFVYPIRSMPVVLQAITYAVPARYYLKILRGIVLKGAPVTAYWEQVLFLVIYAGVVILLAWRRLNRRGI